MSEFDLKRINDMNMLIDRAHQAAVAKGWWDNPKSIAELLALIHSEVSEALEEHRNGRLPDETYYSGKRKTPNQEIIVYGKTPQTKTNFTGKEINCIKPEGIPSELADIVIRVFDMCGFHGIDLVKAIEEKMKYNDSRSYKHGNKVL
jgi:NTP pyrophosphatase (non-canonical NTP hydrolase)